MSLCFENNGSSKFAGCVVDTFEENYPDDSYWYAVVWNGKTFEKVLVSTTAFALSGTAEVDAPTELIERYHRWLAAKSAWETREKLIEIARFAKLGNYTLLKPLVPVYGAKSEAMIACAKLLAVKNFRSAFRKSLREQLETFLRGEGKYETPFTKKQLVCLNPRCAYYA